MLQSLTLPVSHGHYPTHNTRNSMDSKKPETVAVGSDGLLASSGFTLDQCRKMAEDAKEARESGSLRPMAEFDPERILWLVEQVEQLAWENGKGGSFTG